MHWLLSLDHALFHFVNRTLSNPFFDWLMPVLSGEGVPWLPTAIIGLVAAVVFGSTRLKICGLFLLLVVAIGDPLIIGTIKAAVGRARPCLVLADDIVRVPCGGHHSFPSAHSANWFALATVMFFFYRRSVWFMFPLAAAVAISRVYCGVHFPSDITAGTILGAGYAIAILLGTEMLWNSLGKKSFPVWHEKLPSLLNPSKTPTASEKSEIRNPKSEIEWLHLGYAVILLTLVARWFYLRSGILDLSGDEAYQWTWSKHLALSYYSKPLGIALLQKLGTAIGGDTEFGVRFCSPLLAAILSFIVLRFLAREAGARTAFWALIATLTVPLLCVGSVLMTIDPPLVLCWMWATIAGWRAVQNNGTTRDWLVVGLAIGCGFLFKPMAAAQIGCWIILFALLPSARVHLKKSGPWLALGIFLLCTLPFVIWNLQHHWATLGHIAGNTGLDKKWEPTLKFFGEFSAGEFGLLNPVFFIAVLWASFAFWKRRAEKPLWLFLGCMGAPLFYGCWLWSLYARVQPNHPAAAIPPMFCLAALYWHERPRIAKKILIAGILIGIPAVALLHSTSLTKIFFGAKLPGDVDIAHRSRGWRETALAVENERAKFDPNAFILAPDYGATGLYSFYSPAARDAVSSPMPLVYCQRNQRPENQFYFWDSYDYRAHRHGANAIFVSEVSYYQLESGWIWKWLTHQPLNYRDLPAPAPAPKFLAAEFENVTNLGIREIKIDDGRIFHRVQIFGCYGLK